jgi:hypothetical protein
MAAGGDYVMTKNLPGATGTPTLLSADYSLAFGWGEHAAGNSATDGVYELISGYYGGRFGNWQTFKVIRHHIGAPDAKTYFQDGIQVGVPFDAPIQIEFSDQLDERTVSAGITVSAVTDHLGRTSNAPVSLQAPLYDPANRRVTLLPQTAWQGNTFCDVVLTPNLLSIDGFPLDTVYHLPFVTMLDPHQENVVLHPLAAQAVLASQSPSGADAMSIRIPAEALPDFSMVLLSRDPVRAPLRSDPKTIEEANRKASAAHGPYRVPVSLQEINVYNPKGELLGPLAKPAELSIHYGETPAASASKTLIRPRTLALWVLDEKHRLWVKIPASQNAADQRTVTAPVTYFSVFALMGSPDGSAADSYVFPVPWRPHGPRAGTGPGESGTEAEGLTFTNLPSECTIRLYTIAGDLVREIRHSDTGGTMAQEKWDATTAHGDPVASGVYLWRVESSVDAKIGKLMIIR